MPDAPRPSISFPTFLMPGGLNAQAHREHRSGYTEEQAQSRELDRRTNGYWVDFPYSAGRFTVTQPGVVWQVTKANVLVGRYRLMGAELDLTLSILGTLSGATLGIYIQLPERFRARSRHTFCYYGNNGALRVAFVAQIERNANRIIFYRSVNGATANWDPGTAQVAGQFLIEVEES